MKNVEKAERVHLGKLIEEIKYGKYVIPDFQRDFDWKPWDVQDLIKSIFKDYYIGTLLLWKGSKDNFDVLSCKPIYAFEGKSEPEKIVLDGQQRLTAIHYSFFQPNKNFPSRKNPFIYLLDINKIIDEDFEDAIWYESSSKWIKTLLANKEQQFVNHWFPLGMMAEGGWGISDWIKEYRDYWQDCYDNYEDYDFEEEKEELLKYVGNAKVFKTLIEDLLNNYYVSYIELDQNIEIGKVCDIFTHINSKGVSLDIFDLLNAILRPKEVFLKQMWKREEINLEYTDSKKMKIYVLQVMSILAQNYCSSKYLYYLVPDAVKIIKRDDGSKDEVVLVDSKETFKEKWNEAVDAISKTIQTLKNPRDFGAINSNFVPYPSIIPAFSAIKKFVENADFKNKVDINIKIKKWYWASIFLNKYSSSVESTSAKDFQDLKKWFQDDSAILSVVKEFIETYRDLDLKRQIKKGSAIYNAIYNILILNEARDWSTMDLPEYDTLDDHHIVPNSWGKKHIGSDINSILNKTPLSPQTNRKIISDKLPNVYLKEMFENNDPKTVNKVLRSHLISAKAVEILLREDFSVSDYNEFMEERKKSIYDAIEDLILKENVKIPPHLKELDSKIEMIELSLRQQISNIFKDKQPKDIIPSSIQEKVGYRIDTTIKRNPILERSQFESLKVQLDYFDLQEYLALITNKIHWELFEPIYKNKPSLILKFNQLGELRNSIRHSREVSEVVRMEGEAAILWFKEVLK